MLTWQEVWSYIRLLLRWWPVLTLSTLLSAGTAWYLLRDQPDFYITRASVMVGNNFTSSSTPDRGSVEVSNTLASFYEVLLRREVILGAVVERLQLSMPWEALNEMLSTSVNPQANLLEIGITDSNPERAAVLANAIAEQLIVYSPTSQESIAAQQAAVAGQMTELEEAIRNVDQKIADLEARQASLDASIDIRDIVAQLDELRTVKADYQDTYNQLLILRNASTASGLVLFERAPVPTYALPQLDKVTMAAAGLGGLLMAVVAVLVLDRLNTNWRSGADLASRLGIADLGRLIYQVPHSFSADSRGAAQGGAPLRDIHTRIVLGGRDGVPRSLLISSPEPSEARSVFAIDLANIYAQAGHRVLLVDAELAAPHMTKLLLESGEPQTPASDTNSSGPIQLWSPDRGRGPSLPAEIWLRLRPTVLSNVVLLPGSSPGVGSLPRLVPSLHWPELARSLAQAADIVIYDGPSVLTGPDAALLAPLVDGVVLALSPSEHSLVQVAASKARLLTHKAANLIGSVTVSRDSATGSRRAPDAQPPRRGRISISVGAGGIVIRTAKGQGTTGQEPNHAAQQAAEARARRADRVYHQPHEEPVYERAVGDSGVRMAPPPRTPERVPTWEELSQLSEQRGQAAPEHRQQGPVGTAQAEVLITPPPGALITPPPAADSAQWRSQAASQRGSRAARRRTQPGSEAQRRFKRKPLLAENDTADEQ